MDKSPYKVGQYVHLEVLGSHKVLTEIHYLEIDKIEKNIRSEIPQAEHMDLEAD